MKALCLCLLSICVLASAEKVRLTNGERTGDGRLEVNVDGCWGLVCGDNFDMRDAHVVCKQLGYSEEATINTNRIDDNKMPFLVGNVRCTGVEDSLFDCKYDRNPTCDSRRLAGITCGETPVGITGSLGQTAGIIAAIAMCFVAIVGITILLVGCVWRNQLFGINCCGAQNTAVEKSRSDSVATDVSTSYNECFRPRVEVVNLHEYESIDHQRHSYTVSDQDYSSIPTQDINNQSSNNTVITSKNDPATIDNPAYSTVSSHPALIDNPAYIAVKGAPEFMDEENTIQLTSRVEKKD